MRKRVLIVTCELLPVPGQPVRGGGLRVWGLGEGLRAHGHEVVYALPQASVTEDVRLPENLKYYLYVPEGLNDLILEIMPDLIIVEQWGVATFIDDLKIPLVIDLHGPLSLENAFKQSANFLSDALTKIDAIGKADMLICPGQYQRNYFLTWFLMAGADPLNAPIQVVPVSLDKNLPEKTWSDDLHFVFGGVTWPWIDPFPGLELLAKRVAAQEKATLELFVGAPKQRFDHALDTINIGIFRDYRERLKDYDHTQVHELIPRDELLATYCRSSVAYDLYQPNSERQLAFTTRTVEYLWCGLPVIYGDYGELAKPISDYDAGWIVDPGDEAAINAVLDEIFADPQAVRRKGQNARNLAREQYTWERAIEPLLPFVNNPVFRDKKSSVLSGFRNYFRKESLELINQAKDEIEALNRELRQAIGRGDQERRERDNKVDGLSEEIKDLTRQNDQELRKQAEQNRRELEGKETDLRRIQEKIDYEIKVRDEEIKRLHTERRLAEQKALDEVKRLTQEQEKLRETLSAELKTVTEKKDDELKELKREREKERDRLQQRVDLAIAELEGEKKQASDEIKTLNREKETLRESLSAEMRQAIEKKDEEFKDLKKERQVERDKLQARIDELIEYLEAEKVRTADEIKILNREKETTRLKHGEEVKKLVEKHERKLEKIKDKFEEAAKEQLAQFKGDADIRAATERELNRELRLLKQKLETTQTDRNKTLEKMRESHEQLLRTAQQAMQEKISERDDQIKKIAEQVDKAREQLRISLVERDKKLVEASRLLDEERRENEKRQREFKADFDKIRIEKDQATTDLARLNGEILEKVRILEHLVQEKEQYVAHTEQRLGEMADKTNKQAQRNQHLERQLQQVQSDLGKTSSALSDRITHADMLRGDIDKMRPALRDLEGEVVVLRKQASLQQRLLSDFETDENLKTKRRRRKRSYRWLVQLPRLTYLFVVNLATNAYIDKWQNRTGKKIFPGS